MRYHVRTILGVAGFITLPCALLAQAAPTIIPCEGPNMPAICPQASDTARTEAGQRLMETRREDTMALQARQMILQRQALLRGTAPTVTRPPAPPTYQTFQSNPYVAPIAPPDFKAAAQIVGNVITGGPHD